MYQVSHPKMDLEDVEVHTTWTIVTLGLLLCGSLCHLEGTIKFATSLYEKINFSAVLLQDGYSNLNYPHNSNPKCYSSIKKHLPSLVFPLYWNADIYITTR